MTALDRKLVRDILGMKGQMLAITAVIGCGIATFTMGLSALNALQKTQSGFYSQSRFADVFASMKRAPESMVARIRELPGVADVETRVVRDVTLDIPDMNEPATGRIISIPDGREPRLNKLFLRQGRWPAYRSDEEVLSSEGFFKAHQLKLGDTVVAVVNGRRRDLRVVGVALSPEYVYQIRPGALVPDNRRYGVFWMNEVAVSAVFDMEGAFNDITLSTAPGADAAPIVADLDRLLAPFGCTGAHDREDQTSHRFVSDEINQLQRMGLIVPSIFLTVAGFLLNVVLSRIIALQRDQIAALKAFGYTHWSVGWHYTKLVLVIALVGVIGGTLVGCYLGRTIVEMYTQFYCFPELVFELPVHAVALSFVVASGGALVGAASAVLKAVRLPPAEAMRPEAPADYRTTLIELLGLGRLFSVPGKMVLRHLERRPSRAIASIIGMAMSVAIIVLGRFSSDALDKLLDQQFNVVQRHHLSISFVEPTTMSAIHQMEHLPGAMRVEASRIVPVRIRAGHLNRRTIVQGLPDSSELLHLVDSTGQSFRVPEDGLVINTKLAQLLEVKPGDGVVLEVLEGSRRVIDAPITGVVTEDLGKTAYMNLGSLIRVLGDGAAITGVNLTCDQKQIDRLYRELKKSPRVASVVAKAATVRSFREIVLENMFKLQYFNLMFACIIAVGVVYNTARIALSERGRELASLRVLGFTRGEISMVLLAELAVLTIASLPVGLLLGFGFVKFTTLFLDTELYRIPPYVSSGTYSIALTVVLTAAVASALLVRRKLDQLDLIAVLKTRD
jgi:putative ABC transport system permease protein